MRLIEAGESHFYEGPKVYVCLNSLAAVSGAAFSRHVISVTSGTDYTVEGGGYGVTLSDGNGTYAVKGIDTEKPTIALTMQSFKGSYPGIGTAEGSGTRYIDLVPLDINECDGQ